MTPLDKLRLCAKKRALTYKCFWRCGDPRCPMAMPVQKRAARVMQGRKG